MKIDWVVVWQEFENELSNRLQEGVLNEWSIQQEIIECVIERNLTPRALDACPHCQGVGTSNIHDWMKCAYCHGTGKRQ